MDQPSTPPAAANPMRVISMLLSMLLSVAMVVNAAEKPNIVFIMAGKGLSHFCCTWHFSPLRIVLYPRNV